MIAVAGLMLSFLAYSILTSWACALSLSSILGSGLRRILQSWIPVKDTPNNRSSSQFFCHTLRTYLNSVREACSVPRIVARPILRLRSSSVSSTRHTTSDRLHSCPERSWISAQGLVPTKGSELRRSGARALAPARLKMPRSPEPDFIRAIHSSINTAIEGFCS